jgi:esterase/lipase superfamily enzyme
VERFSDWLTTLTVQHEVANGLGGGAGKARIVLIGHSMGGLLAADSLREMVSSRPDPKAPLWPKIIACIAFDTPVSTQCDASIVLGLTYGSVLRSPSFRV